MKLQEPSEKPLKFLPSKSSNKFLVTEIILKFETHHKISLSFFLNKKVLEKVFETKFIC
jgi:hypothetical protein